MRRGFIRLPQLALAAALACGPASAATVTFEQGSGQIVMLGPNAVAWLDNSGLVVAASELSGFVAPEIVDGAWQLHDGQALLIYAADLQAQELVDSLVTGFDIDTSSLTRLLFEDFGPGLDFAPDGTPGFQTVSTGASKYAAQWGLLSFGDYRVDNISYVAKAALPGSDPQPSPGGVPEPATWALMILGFGGAGAMLRRRAAVLA